MTYDELKQIVPAKIYDSDSLVHLPIDFTVDEYPPVPRPSSTEGTDEQWTEFWIKRDAFMYGYVCVPERCLK